MRGIVNTPGRTSPIDLRDVPEPEPSTGEAVVGVAAFSLNRGELTLLRNRPDGWRPGQDIAGTVVEAAADGTGPPEGARVVALVDQAGWAERAAVATARMAPLPEKVAFADAATLPIAGLTALRALRLADALLGKRVLVPGAAGGFGRFAVQLAAAGGAVVTAVAAGDRATGLERLGATEVVARMEDAEGPFEVVLESVGGQSLAAAFALIAADGLIVVLGNSTNEATPFNFFDFFGHEDVTLRMFFSYHQTDPVDADLATLVDLIAAGRLRPPIGHRASWHELAAALEALADRRVNGKVVLDVQ